SGRFGVVLTESSYPMPSVITELGDEFNIPFVLSIARQESEFNISAISGARAYGMMQMINATAKLTARKHRIKYHKSWLTADQNYAAKLGAHHLNDLLKKYDGSYIMAAVAYNAGPNRVTRWNKRYGDPRKGEIDAIDWLENIPFSETRNYVQRVMENMQVYNARLNNGQAPLELESDINAGAFR
ncbi:MAG: lytic transglycosylase domain-containing protein, partial [Robiginitomaculum sp.]